MVTTTSSTNIIETIFVTVEETSKISGSPVHIVRKLILKKDFSAIKIGARWWIHRQKFHQRFDKQLKEKAS